MDGLIHKFHHFGLAISSYENSSKFLKIQNYELGMSVYDENQKVFCSLNIHETLPPIEFLWAGDEESPIDNILKNHKTSIYHICYEITDLEEMLNFYRKHNIPYSCISKPLPAVLFNGRKVCFFFIDGFGIVEFLLNE